MWAASFNCAKAQSPLEKAICSNPTLSAADDELNSVWRSTIKTFPLPAFLRSTQQMWLKNTAACTKAQPGSCVDAFRERTTFLKNLGLPVSSGVSIKVYTNYGKEFSIDFVTLVVFETDTAAFIWMYGDWMPDMNHPEPPPNGFLLDEVSRIKKNDKGKSVIEGWDCEVVVAEDRITFGTGDRALFVSARQAPVEGVFERIR
jgi:hypothetical protein